MALPIITTKIKIPPARAKILPRPRVFARLDAGKKRKLTLISAPAGYGKTTLLSEWAHQTKNVVAWISLDENDNDLGQFISYIAAALQVVIAGFGESTCELLLSFQPSQSRLLLTTLLNEIANLSLHKGFAPEHISLVLDDYHLIENQSIHEAVDFLLDYLPDQLRIVIASRTDPPLALPRLRVRGQMIELRAKDLRFTYDEAMAFLNQVMELWLSPDDITALETRTEGWIATLQLAALAMQGREDRGSFVRAFTGSHRYVLDYLADEVFYHQPEYIQDFLLNTAILDRLSGDLCNATTGRTDSQEILEHLERANLFTLPLDDERHWYRYHHIFADLLRYHLKQSHPSQIPELHRRASQWYAKNERLYEALGHALATDDIQFAVKIAEKTNATVVMRGEAATLLGWLNALPSKVVQTNARLSLTYAWALYVTADMDGIEPRLQDAIKALGVGDIKKKKSLDSFSDEVKEYLGEITALQVLSAIYQKTSPPKIEEVKRALEYLPPDTIYRIPVMATLGDVYHELDDLQSAKQAYLNVLSASERHGLISAMVIHNDLARLHITQGQLHQAESAYQRVLDWGSQRHTPTYAVGQAYIGMGDLLREWNRLDEAAKNILSGIEQCQLGGYSRYLITGHIALARIRYAQGNIDNSLKQFQKAEEIAEKVGIDRLLAKVAAQKVRLGLAGENLAVAAHWAQNSKLRVQDHLSYPYEFEYLTLARFLIAEGTQQANPSSLDAAGKLLDRLLQAAEAAGRTGSIIEIQMLQALTLHAQGRTADAMLPLENALSLAEPEGYVRLFVDEGAPMAELLEFAISSGVKQKYAKDLFAMCKDLSHIKQNSLADPLTNRELEVLKLLAHGLSNREIANELSISMNTVGTHTKRLYTKLDVHNRTQAGTRAGELNLL